MRSMRRISVSGSDTKSLPAILRAMSLRTPFTWHSDEKSASSTLLGLPNSSSKWRYAEIPSPETRYSASHAYVSSCGIFMAIDFASS